ncbi:MAG TPA: sialidase family protein [Chloroflexia bacterium]|nr:sialidase family protein [Chloroflexia bacterium]
MSKVAQLQPRVALFMAGLLLLSLLSATQLTGSSPVRAAEPGWQETPLTLDTTASNINYCFDATRPDRLFINRTDRQAGTLLYNLATGEKTTFNDHSFYHCNESNGLLYAYKEANFTGAIVFSSDNPQGRELAHTPTAFASDGTLYTYSAENEAGGKNSRFFASPDGGLTWQERGQLFAGKRIESVAVTEADGRSLYVLAKEILDPQNTVQGNTIYFSPDAGATWEKRYDLPLSNRVPFGPTLFLQTLSGRNAPVNYLVLRTFYGAGSNGFATTALSTDGGRTFSDICGDGKDGFCQLYYASNGLVKFSRTSYTYSTAFSSDGGKTWTSYPVPYNPPGYDIQYGGATLTFFQAENAPNAFFLYDSRPNGFIWQSTDNGYSWHTLGRRMAGMKVSPYAPLALVGIENNKFFKFDLSLVDQNQTRGVPATGASGSNFYPATQHNLSGVFLNYWTSHGGLAQFGYPHTEPFREYNPADGKIYLVQYFERNRFEYHPELAGTNYEVLLGLLGNQLTADRRAAGDGAFNHFDDMHYPGGTYFSQTGHNLRNSFKEYWEKNGGLAIYGYPISEEFYELNPDDGKTYVVQYFERNRFEYHPENKGTQYEVLLGLLGNTLLKQKGWL